MVAWGRAAEALITISIWANVNIRILTDEIDMDRARAKKECGSELG